MAVEQFANHLTQTTLTVGVSSGATTITVASVVGLPTAPQFRLRIDDELLLVTSLAGSTLTVGRGQEGTTAAAHNAGAIVGHVLTAAAVRALRTSGVLEAQRDFGAAGDGSTDDTTAINNAIAAVNAAGGGTVLLGPATYVVQQIVPMADVELRGAGMNATTLKLKNAANTNIVSATNAHRFVMRDLTLDGNDANQGAGNWTGVLLSTSHEAQIRRVRLVNVDWIGIALAGCQHCEIAECDVDTPDYIGVWVATSGATHSTGTRVVRNRIYSCGLDGVIVDCDDVLVAQNWIEAAGRVSGASGVYVGNDRRSVRIEDNHCTGTTNYGIDFDNATTDDDYGCVVVGNVCVGNTNSGIGCNSSGAVITGNSCRNNGQGAGTYPYGILLDAKNLVCVGNRCSDTQVSKTQTYGIALRNASGVTTKATIVGNSVEGNVNTGILNINSIGSGHVVAGNQGADDILGGDPQRVWASPVLTETGTFQTTSGTAYFVYLGRTTQPITPTRVYALLTTAGLGSQTAEVGLFSSPSAPNKAGQTLTKLVANTTLDSLTATPPLLRGNTSAMATSIPAGTYLWAGIRIAMATTQPTFRGLQEDWTLGALLTTAAATAFGSGTSYVGAVPAIGAGTIAPALRATLD